MANIISDAVGIFALPATKRQPKAEGGEDVNEAVSADAGVTKAIVENVLSSFVDLVSQQVSRGNEVGYPGLGAFTRTLRPARKGHNPSTGAAIDIPARYAVQFRPAKPLRDAMPAVKGAK
jgi:DNA-binding protein HU-beta